MLRLRIFVTTLLIGLSLIDGHSTLTCRLGFDKLEKQVLRALESVLQPDRLEAIFWPEEPLNAESLRRVTGLDVTFAETKFKVASLLSQEVKDGSEQTTNKKPNSMVRDLMIGCSADRDRSYKININLNILNPFNEIEMRLRNGIIKNANRDDSELVFKIRLLNSSFIVQLEQKMDDIGCVVVRYVQLDPSVAYELECLNCDDEQSHYFEKLFVKRMSLIDPEIDGMLSDKLVLALQSLFGQVRLGLDMN